MELVSQTPPPLKGELGGIIARLGTRIAATALEQEPSRELVLARPQNRSRLLTFEEFRARQEARADDLVPGVLGCDELAVLYGKPKDGKTYLALDLMLSVAAGLPWAGRAVREGLVVYVPADDTNKLDERILAWAGSRGVPVPDQDHFRLLDDPVNLTEPREVERLIADIRSLPAPPVLVVLDTLNAVMGVEDENGRGMTAVVDATRRLRAATGATVLVLHHTGKDASLRGHSSLRGAAARVWKLKKDGLDLTLLSEDNRHGQRFAPMGFRLVPTAGADGPCTVEFMGGSTPETSTEIRALGDTVKKALDVLRGQFPNGAKYGAWRKATGLTASQFKNIPARLRDDGYVVQDDEDGLWRATNA